MKKKLKNKEQIRKQTHENHPLVFQLAKSEMHLLRGVEFTGE